MSRRLRIAVPNLGSYTPTTGIGRVLTSLQEHWDDVDLVPARYLTPRLHVLRNVPSGVAYDGEADLILISQLTGASALRAKKRPPAVVIVHDIGVVDCPEDRAATDAITRWTVERSFAALPHAERVVAVSRFTADRLAHFLPELKGRTEVIPNAVGEAFRNLTATRDAALKHVLELANGAPVRAPALLYVGSEIPRKNVGVLIDTFAAVRRTHPAAQLWKVGSAGGQRWRAATLDRMAAHRLIVGEDVLFFDGVSDADLALLYRAGDAFVTASLYEGFGLPVAEAMAAGTPVVVSDRGALPEVVGGTSPVVEPTVDQLEAAVTRTLGEYGINTPSHRTGTYTWATTAATYRELFEQLAADSSAAS